jgi:hypothetical protein
MRFVIKFIVAATSLHSLGETARTSCPPTDEHVTGSLVILLSHVSSSSLTNPDCARQLSAFMYKEPSISIHWRSPTILVVSVVVADVETVDVAVDEAVDEAVVVMVVWSQPR